MLHFIDVIRFRLTELYAEYQLKHGRKLTAVELSEATGLNRMTLSRMQNSPGYNTSTDTVEKICRFFGCNVQDLMVIVDDDEVSPKTN